MPELLLRDTDRVDACDRAEIAELFAALTVEAGPAVMEVYGRACRVSMKADSSPVCEADELSEGIILGGLRRHLAGVAVVAEEASARGETPATGNRFILVDPLDGTREFLCRNGEFTLNIAMIDDGIPIAGAVYAPALDRLWYGGEEAFVCSAAPGAASPLRLGAQRIRTRQPPADGLVALASRSHADPATEAFLGRLPIRERRSAGSSLKFCVLAEGRADVYPRFGPTMEWDTAAGDAVLRAAGGVVEAREGGSLRYGKSEAQFRNGGFVAWGDPQCRWRDGQAAIA